ncbi:MAG: DUF3467 domain-containing protein [Pseudomonadota bacterium]
MADKKEYLQWDPSQVRSEVADAVAVAGGKEQIVLSFGRHRPPAPGDEAITVDCSDRIILGPRAAKRLSVLLDHAVGDWERSYGAIAGGIRAPAGRAEPAPAEEVAAFENVAADRLFSLVQTIDAPVGFERSFKLFDRTLLAHRFLMGFKKTAATAGVTAKVMDICRRTDMPAAYRDLFQKHLPASNIVLFGFEENEAGSVYKAYLEFGGQFESVLRENPADPAPFLLHLGFKWDTADNRRRALARYVCFPAYGIDDMRDRLSAVFYDERHKTPFTVTCALLRLARERMMPERPLYLEVSEDGSPRRSFDINLYRANLRMETLYPLLADLCRHYRIPMAAFHDVYDPVRTRFFGHLSGGVDRQGRDFLTIYYGVKGSTG